MAKAVPNFNGRPASNMPIYRLCYWSVPRRRWDDAGRQASNTPTALGRSAQTDARPGEPPKPSESGEALD